QPPPSARSAARRGWLRPPRAAPSQRGPAPLPLRRRRGPRGTPRPRRSLPLVLRLPRVLLSGPELGLDLGAPAFGAALYAWLRPVGLLPRAKTAKVARMFPAWARRKVEDPRNLWNRGAGAPRCLLGLLGPRARDPGVANGLTLGPRASQCQ